MWLIAYTSFNVKWRSLCLGNNENGQIGDGSDSECQSIPIKLNDFVNEKFKAVSCGAVRSLLLSVDGRVFVCGRFQSQRSREKIFETEAKLTHIEMGNTIIEKIGCGLYKTLLLSIDGDIYECGFYRGVDRFTKINISDKFSQIATFFNEITCATLSKNGFYYVWGECGRDILIELKVTNFKSFNDILIKYCQITYKLIEGTIFEFKDDFFRKDYFEQIFDEKEKLGEGSYGQVFKAKFKSNSKQFYAIKKISFEANKEKDHLKELEIYSLTSKFNNKNIVKFFLFLN